LDVSFFRPFFSSDGGEKGAIKLPDGGDEDDCGNELGDDMVMPDRGELNPDDDPSDTAGTGAEAVRKDDPAE
jgi:hypothetical protein